MNRVNRKKNVPQQTRRNVRFSGIKRHARELGVTHPHLWRVLVGERTSPGLLARYRHLVKCEGAAGGTI